MADLGGTPRALSGVAETGSTESGPSTLSAPQMTMLPPYAGPELHEACLVAGGHYCPHCLRRVSAALAQRRTHRETCASGALEVTLLHCPTCGLVLAAETEPPTRWAHTVA